MDKTALEHAVEWRLQKTALFNGILGLNAANAGANLGQQLDPTGAVKSAIGAANPALGLAMSPVGKDAAGIGSSAVKGFINSANSSPVNTAEKAASMFISKEAPMTKLNSAVEWRLQKKAESSPLNPAQALAKTFPTPESTPTLPPPPVTPKPIIPADIKAGGGIGRMPTPSPKPINPNDIKRGALGGGMGGMFSPQTPLPKKALEQALEWRMGKKAGLGDWMTNNPQLSSSIIGGLGGAGLGAGYGYLTGETPEERAAKARKMALIGGLGGAGAGYMYGSGSPNAAPGVAKDMASRTKGIYNIVKTLAPLPSKMMQYHPFGIGLRAADDVLKGIGNQ